MTDIVVPALGESVSEAIVATWLKKEGEAVAMDEPIVELETDKVTLEVPAPQAGVVGKIIVAEGETVEVGAVLGSLEAGDGKAVAPANDPAEKAEKPAAKPAEKAVEAVVGANAPMSPAVRKMVGDHNLDPSQIPATGKGGRLTKADVQSYINAGGASKAASTDGAAMPVAAPADREERVRMSGMRRKIAERLKDAQNTAAMLTTFNEVDMTAVMELRKQYQETFTKKHGTKLGFMSFFVKACVQALKEFPAVNAEIDGTDMVYKNYHDISIAVSSPNGLVVPALRDADSLSFADIEKTIVDMGMRARDGEITAAEMMGGTFTITNGGIFGSLLSTPILNPPQSAILGMHKIQPRPMVMPDGSIAARPMMYLALTYDHRIVDGKEAVSFLVAVKNAIEDPQRLVLDI